MGNMPKYLSEICGQKTFTYMGCGEVVMPENYIAMFNAPERVEAVKIIKNADMVIKQIVDVIRHNGTIPKKKVGAFAKEQRYDKYLILSAMCKCEEILCD